MSFHCGVRLIMDGLFLVSTLHTTASAKWRISRPLPHHRFYFPPHACVFRQGTCGAEAEETTMMGGWGGFDVFVLFSLK